MQQFSLRKKVLLPTLILFPAVVGLPLLSMLTSSGNKFLMKGLLHKIKVTCMPLIVNMKCKTGQSQFTVLFNISANTQSITKDDINDKE